MNLNKEAVLEFLTNNKQQWQDILDLATVVDKTKKAVEPVQNEVIKEWSAMYPLSEIKDMHDLFELTFDYKDDSLTGLLEDELDTSYKNLGFEVEAGCNPVLVAEN